MAKADTPLGYILTMASGVGVSPLLVSGHLSSIPREIDEAAAMDGAGYLRYMFTFLPRLMAPVLSTTFVLQAIGVWNDSGGATRRRSHPRTAGTEFHVNKPGSRSRPPE